VSAGAIAKVTLKLGAVAAVALSGVVALSAPATGGPVTTRAPLQVGPTKLPASTLGQLRGVAAVPHSTDVWVEGIAGINNHPVAARRHNRHWRRIAAPALGGTLGAIRGIAAGSVHSIWLAGSRQIARSEQAPAVWRWTGKRFALAKLPKLADGDSTAMSISASSATNAWVVGQMDFAGTNDPATLHRDGKRWIAVPAPAPFMAVGTSGPRNAWALGLDAVSLFHWNGLSWSPDGAAHTAASLVDVATTSPTAAYAVGAISGETGPFHALVLRFNGKTWSRARLAARLPHVFLSSVTMRGSTAWAVGFGDTGKGPETPAIVDTVGGIWRSQRSSGDGADLVSVSAATVHRAYAVGSQSAHVSATRSLFDVFHGHVWRAAPSRF
jgi:hypothetical protein